MEAPLRQRQDVRHDRARCYVDILFVSLWVSAICATGHDEPQQTDQTDRALQQATRPCGSKNETLWQSSDIAAIPLDPCTRRASVQC